MKGIQHIRLAVQHGTWLLLILLVCGCSDNRLWEEQKTLAGGVWKSKDPLTFHFLIQEIDKAYNLYISTRYDVIYPFYNMYVSYKLSNPQAEISKKARIELLLFDSKNGKPVGNGSTGFFFKEDTLLVNHRFSTPGRYTLKVQQSMRTDSLMGIHNIGLHIHTVTPPL